MSSSKQDNYNTTGETQNTEENGKNMKTEKERRKKSCKYYLWGMTQTSPKGSHGSCGRLHKTGSIDNQS